MSYVDLSPTEYDIMIHVWGLEPLGYEFSTWLLSQLVRVEPESLRSVIIRLERKGFLVCRREGNKRNGRKLCTSLARALLDGDGNE